MLKTDKVKIPASTSVVRRCWLEWDSGRGGRGDKIVKIRLRVHRLKVIYENMRVLSGGLNSEHFAGQEGGEGNKKGETEKKDNQFRKNNEKRSSDIDKPARKRGVPKKQGGLRDWPNRPVGCKEGERVVPKLGGTG